MRLWVPFLAAALAGACSGEAVAPAASHPATTSSAPHAGATIPPQDDSGDWLRPAKDLSSSRFSGLTEITAESVKQLGVKMTFSTGVVKGHEAAPLVVNGTMFIVTPYPNFLYALDLTKPGAPLKWKYEPKPLLASQGVACCDVVNRGAV
jgi:glucose dehydrogenase